MGFEVGVGQVGCRGWQGVRVGVGRVKGLEAPWADCPDENH